MIPKRVIAVVFVVLLGLLVSGDWVQRLSRAEADMAENALLPVSEATEGQLRVVGKDGQPAGLCPLKTTRVTGNISGFMGRVDVVQVFTNPLKEKIEAIYVFPLPSGAAVDAMEMMVGTRKVVGEIKKREEARQIYENAKNAGQVASLLDQERPNIFTQSVANIMPGETVKVRISYIDTLKYDDGAYEFVFPMVVGPRFMPGAATGKSGTGTKLDTNTVPDASKISPPITPEGTRSGHDITLELTINAGVPIGDVQCVSHDIDTDKQNSSTMAVALRSENTIPNKDFILRYAVAGNQVRSGLLSSCREPTDGYFSMMIVPPKAPTQQQIVPKEMIFVIDTSGSQMGWPVEKSKETMKRCIENLNPNDTFQMFAFNNAVDKLFEAPQPSNEANRALAQKWVGEKLGGGGTQMLSAVIAALTPPADPKRLRIVCFMTDGYVGNDMQILDEVRKNLGGARLFPFGIGSSPNRFLLDGMAEMGRGAVEYVTLDEKGQPKADKFQERISHPVLTDISIDWGGLTVMETYPKLIPDLFDYQPVIIKGRYAKSGTGVVTIKGNLGGKPWSGKLDVNLSPAVDTNPALASLWARAKIGDLTAQDYAGVQSGNPRPLIKDQVTQIALEYHLMSQFTSFVAVEQMTVTTGGQPRTVNVPVELPEGMDYDGVQPGLSAKGARRQLGISLNFATAAKIMGGAAVAGRANQLSLGAASSGYGRVNAPSQPSGPAATMPLAAKPADGRQVDRKLTVTGTGVYNTYGDAPQDGPALLEGKKADRLSAADQAIAKKRAVIAAKLDPSLLGLAKKLDKQGNAKVGKVVVRAGKLLVIIRLTDDSAANLAQLKKLGFALSTLSKSVKAAVGTADAKKLDELALLGFVISIEPVN